MPPRRHIAVGVALAATLVLLVVRSVGESEDTPARAMPMAPMAPTTVPSSTAKPPASTEPALVETQLAPPGTVGTTPSRGVDAADYFGAFRKAKRLKKLSDADRPRSTLVSGFGDKCFTKSKRVAPRSGGSESTCLPPPGAGDAGRCIEARRSKVLAFLDAHNFTVEVWFMAGRKGYLPITPHYLKPMLRDFGGVAARVVWLYEEPQTYVKSFAEEHYADLVKRQLFVPLVRGNIRRMYRRSITARNALIVKFDDDTVFLQEHSLTAMMAEMLDDQSRCIVVSGNVVNHVGLNPVHFRLGALDVAAAAASSPRAAAAHKMHYDGYQRNVLGSYQEPIEWRQAHWSLLRALRENALDRFYFDRSVLAPSARGLPACGTMGGATTFDFQCDGLPRRWGINLIAFPALDNRHFGAMRDLGHLVKNKDEVYFSMHMGRHTEGGRNHTCAVPDAIGVHFLNTGQASNLRRVLGVPTDGSGGDPRARDASVLAPEVLRIYRDVAEHFGGLKQCCKATGCTLFDERWLKDPNVLFPLA